MIKKINMGNHKNILKFMRIYKSIEICCVERKKYLEISMGFFLPKLLFSIQPSWVSIEIQIRCIKIIGD